MPMRCIVPNSGLRWLCAFRRENIQELLHGFCQSCLVFRMQYGCISGYGRKARSTAAVIAAGACALARKRRQDCNQASPGMPATD